VQGAPRRGVVALIGLGEAIALLGLRYDSDEARAVAATMARIVAEALRTAIDGSATLSVVIGREPRLALLANATSDGADPIEEEHVVRWPDRGGDRRTRALGPALTLRRERALAGATLPAIETARELGPAARQALVRALAPWVDADTGPQPVDSGDGAARGAAQSGSVA
jgi:hypothetical protein